MELRPATAGLTTRTIEYAGLSALVVGVFLAVVVGLGAALGIQAPNPGLTLAAAGLLALVFEPARQWLHRSANRLVYGHRRSPWDAVSRLATQIGDGTDPSDQIGELAEVVLAGTGASQVVVWLREGTTWTAAATAPPATEALPATAEALPATGDDFPRVAGADLTVPIRHGGEALGAVTVSKSGTLTPLERRLVGDLAIHAGIITRTLHLQQRLRRRLEVSRRQQRELVASRARVVAAQDEERRRLERDIHDTCQQPVVVLAGRLGLAAALAHRDPDQARCALDEAGADLARLRTALERLVSATPSPELVLGGIATALRQEAASLPVPVEVDDRLTRRYRHKVEVAVHLCCMEAIQNATKHARASRISVQLADRDECLTFRVGDDGTGFDTDHPGPGTGLRNMRERLRDVGARLVVRSSPAGTEISAEIPVPPEEEAS